MKTGSVHGQLRALLLALAAGMLFCLLLPCAGLAEESADADQNGIPDAVEKTAPGIVRVQAVVSDRDDAHRSVKKQAGFLIGDESAGYVVTAYRDLLFSDEEKESLRAKWSEGQEREVTLSETGYEIIYNGDIHKKAALYEGSREKDIAILRLDSPLDGALALTLAGDEEDIPDQVWAASYPPDTSSYSEATVRFLFGSFEMQMEEEDRTTLFFDVRPDEGCSGTPILNEYGRVLGVYSGQTQEGSGNGSAFSTLARMLDQEKIAYRAYQAPSRKGPGKAVYILGAVALVLLILIVVMVIRSGLSRKKGGAGGKALPGNPRILRIRGKEIAEITSVPFVIGSLQDRTSYCIRGNSRVSRLHAALYCERGRFFLADLGSRNGTVLNGKKLAPREKERLKDGDSFFLADEEFVFRV